MTGMCPWPARTRSLFVPLVLVAAALSACGTEPSAEAGVGADSGVTPDAGTSDAQGDAVGVDAQVDGSGSDVVAPPDVVEADADADIMDPPGPDPGLVAACEGACFEREQLAEPLGFCDLRDGRDCVDFCVDAVGDQPGDLRNALVICLKTDPLCFQTPLQCVLDRRYPEPFEHTTTLVGEGFDAWPTAAVYAAMEREGHPGTYDIAEGRVDASGRFAIEISGVRSANSPHNIFYFVDSDPDGGCDETREMVGSAGLDLFLWDWDDIRIPDWRVTVRPDASRRTAFACDLLEDAWAP